MKTFRYIANGYVRVFHEGKWVSEHRLVWQTAHGPIPPGWHVHHINGDRADNRLENLMAMSHGDHTREHKKKPKRPCKTEGCPRHSDHKRGYCQTCYQRLFRKEKLRLAAHRRYHANLERRRKYARNWYRKKHGLPVDD